MSNLVVPFPVFSVLWMNEDEFAVCGGGEKNEIDKRICIFNPFNNFEKTLEFETKCALLRMDYSPPTGLFVGAGMRSLFVFQLENPDGYEMKELCERSIEANPYPDSETKLCCISKNENEKIHICASDDSPSVVIYELVGFSKNKTNSEVSLKEITTLENEDQITFLKYSVIRGDHERTQKEMIIFGDAAHTVTLYCLSSRRIEAKFSGDPKLPKIIFADFLLEKDQFCILQTSRETTNCSIFDNVHELLYSKKEEEKEKSNPLKITKGRRSTRIISKGSISVSSIIENDRYVSLSCRGEILLLYDIQDKCIVSQKKINGCMAITCNDFIKKRKLFHVINGSILNCVNLTTFKKRKYGFYVICLKLLFWMICGLLFASFLSYMEENNNNNNV